MRKVVLAAAALAVLGAGQALASNSDSGVIVTTQVDRACNVTITETNVSLPADAIGTAVGNFTYVCNFTDTTADLAWASTNGGVKDGANPAHDYSIVSSLGGSGTASAPPTDSNVTTSANIVSAPQTVTLKLLAAIDVAGTYTDTLAVTISP